MPITGAVEQRTITASGSTNGTTPTGGAVAYATVAAPGAGSEPTSALGSSVVPVVTRRLVPHVGLRPGVGLRPSAHLGGSVTVNPNAVWGQIS